MNHENPPPPPPPPRSPKPLALGVFIATALLALEQSQAQLFINVYPSQDSPTNQTLWVFSGSSTTDYAGTTSIRSSGNFHWRDSFPLSGNLYNANRPNNQLPTLSPLLSSSNAKDIASVNARIPGGGKTNITFAASATNTPTITIAGRGTRTIARLFMDEDAYNSRDGLGIRNQPPNLLYGSGEAFSWVGAGLIDKPIGDFFAGTFNDHRDGGGAVHFTSGISQIRITVNSQVIPEPEEYALVFALFALAFVFFRRHFQKKRQTTASPLPF